MPAPICPCLDFRQPTLVFLPASGSSHQPDIKSTYSCSQPLALGVPHGSPFAMTAQFTVSCSLTLLCGARSVQTLPLGGGIFAKQCLTGNSNPVKVFGMAGSQGEHPILQGKGWGTHRQSGKYVEIPRGWSVRNQENRTGFPKGLGPGEGGFRGAETWAKKQAGEHRP